MCSAPPRRTPISTRCSSSAAMPRFSRAIGYQWRFTHDKLREALLAEMDRETRRELSRKAAAAIESVYGAAPDWIHAQAVLWKDGGVPDKAAHYLLLAAAQLLSTGSPETGRGAARSTRPASSASSCPSPREQQGAAIGAEMAADRRADGRARVPRNSPGCRGSTTSASRASSASSC